MEFLEKVAEIDETNDYHFETSDVKDEIKCAKRKTKKDLNDLHLYVQNKETGEIKGVIYNYVVDETLYLCTGDRKEAQSLRRYLEALEDEAEDEIWNDKIEVPEGYVKPDEADENYSNLDDDDDNDDDCIYVLTEEDMQERRYEWIISMPTRIYVGDLNEGPREKPNESFPIIDLDSTKDGVILMY